jgi:hypothetical protein
VWFVDSYREDRLMDDKNGYGAQLFFLIAAIVILLGLTRV